MAHGLQQPACLRTALRPTFVKLRVLRSTLKLCVWQPDRKNSEIAAPDRRPIMNAKPAEHCIFVCHMPHGFLQDIIQPKVQVRFITSLHVLMADSWVDDCNSHFHLQSPHFVRSRDSNCILDYSELVEKKAVYIVEPQKETSSQKDTEKRNTSHFTLHTLHERKHIFHPLATHHIAALVPH